MLFNVVRKHLQPHAITLYRPAIKTRYLFCSNIFQDVEKVNQTQFRCVPEIWENVIFQDFNISELKRIPIIILLRIQNLSVIILPKYINNMDSRDSKLKNPDNSHSDPRSKPGIEDMNRNSEVLQDQETPPRAILYSDKKARALSPDGQQDPSEAPSKKMKATDHFLFMGVTEAAITPEETKDKQKITDTVSENNISPSATQHNLDHNKDKFSLENEVSGIKMSIEQDPTAALKTSDSDTQKEANPSQTETADIVMNPPDADLHHQSSSDASSSAAEANNKSVITSENLLQKIVVSETRDTKPIIDEQPEEDNHTPPAKRRGYRGLRNQGATCYLNAVLQTLFMTKDFRDVIIELKLKKGKKKSLSFELQKLFKDLESNTKSATTHGVTNALEIGNVCEQQDAAEYYQKILSMIEPEAAKIFQGQKKHSTTCKHGNHDPVEEYTSFFSLAIAMDSDQHKINVKESFDAQFEVMHMDGEDQLFCETCNTMRDMKMSCTISELPDVLTLHLQRFYLDYCYMIYRKNNCPVEIPLQLKVQDDHIYDLYALVNHTGSLSGGHYYTDIKSFDDQQWYEFNDSTVQKIPKKYDVRDINSNIACLLFFKKSAKQNGHEANAQEKKTVMRSDQSKSPQNNTTSSPEDSVIQPHLHTDHISNNSANNYDITVSIEQDPTAGLSTSDSDTQKEANPSQTETADIVMNPPDADRDHQSSSDASSSAAEADNKSVITSENLLQKIVVSETRDTKPIIDEQPEEDNHTPPAKRREITRSTSSKVSRTESPEQCTQRAIAWPKDGHKKSLKDECKTPHNDRISVQICINCKDIVNRPTDSDTETEANLEKQIMNPEPPETAHNESDLDNDEARAQYNSFLPETTVSRRRILPFRFRFIGIICLIGIIVFIILVLYSFYGDF